MKTAVLRLDLGVTRKGVGYTLFDHQSKAFDELTPRYVRALIKEHVVNGLCLVDDHDIIPDSDWADDLMAKSGVGNFRPCIGSDVRSKQNTMMAVVSVNESDIGTVYEVITNHCQRILVNEDELKGFIRNFIVGGASLDKDEKVCLMKGVEHFHIDKPVSNSVEDVHAALHKIEEVKPIEQNNMADLMDMLDKVDKLLDDKNLFDSEAMIEQVVEEDETPESKNSVTDEPAGTVKKPESIASKPRSHKKKVKA